MYATLVASKRYGHLARYRFECEECNKIGRWTSSKDTALIERDQHNAAKHGGK